eukprot:6199988-Pleurochrysis_carterae.AAC.1
MESNQPSVRSVSLIARQSEICPSIMFGELQYAQPVAANREAISWRNKEYFDRVISICIYMTACCLFTTAIWDTYGCLARYDIGRRPMEHLHSHHIHKMESATIFSRIDICHATYYGRNSRHLIVGGSRESR